MAHSPDSLASKGSLDTRYKKEHHFEPVLNAFNTGVLWMPAFSTPAFTRRAWLPTILLTALLSVPVAQAQSAYVRVDQAGYESGKAPFRAYLMSNKPVTGVKFKVVNSKGATAFSGTAGALLGTWSHSQTVSYDVYALDFTAPAGERYTISVSKPAAASPVFAVDCPEKLYSGLLLNTLFFYQTQRDGANFVPNALRSAPGHLKDQNARVYRTPVLDDDDFINNVPPKPPLIKAGLPDIDAARG